MLSSKNIHVVNTKGQNLFALEKMLESCPDKEHPKYLKAYGVYTGIKIEILKKDPNFNINNIDSSEFKCPST